MGVVRYVGRVEFAPGIWVGLELRDPKGRHDGKNSGDVCIVSVNHVCSSGTVQGRRYFNCKSSHGLIVRPRLVSVHGISGEDLIRPENEYPF